MLNLNCDCGYDYTQPTGHPKDAAACGRCSWSSTGIYADHSAYHHHLDTKHEWYLTMGNRL